MCVKWERSPILRYRPQTHERAVWGMFDSQSRVLLAETPSGAVGGSGVEESLFEPILSCVLVGDAVSF